jgi:hypothetical protein
VKASALMIKHFLGAHGTAFFGINKCCTSPPRYVIIEKIARGEAP